MHSSCDNQPMQRLTPRQLAILVLLTLVWGVNWPVMKLGVTAYPPLTFRALSTWLGLPVLFGLAAAGYGVGAALVWLGIGRSVSLRRPAG